MFAKMKLLVLLAACLAFIAGMSGTAQASIDELLQNRAQRAAKVRAYVAAKKKYDAFMEKAETKKLLAEYKPAKAKYLEVRKAYRQEVDWLVQHKAGYDQSVTAIKIAISNMKKKGKSKAEAQAIAKKTQAYKTYAEYKAHYTPYKKAKAEFAKQRASFKPLHAQFKLKVMGPYKPLRAAYVQSYADYKETVSKIKAQEATYDKRYRAIMANNFEYLEKKISQLPPNDNLYKGNPQAELMKALQDTGVGFIKAVSGKVLDNAEFGVVGSDYTERIANLTGKVDPQTYWSAVYYGKKVQKVEDIIGRIDQIKKICRKAQQSELNFKDTSALAMHLMEFNPVGATLTPMTEYTVQTWYKIVEAASAHWDNLNNIHRNSSELFLFYRAGKCDVVADVNKSVRGINYNTPVSRINQVMDHAYDVHLNNIKMVAHSLSKVIKQYQNDKDKTTQYIINGMVKELQAMNSYRNELQNNKAKFMTDFVEPLIWAKMK